MDIRHHLTTGQAAEYLEQELKQRVHNYDLDNLLRDKLIDPPEMIGGRRMWSHDDLKAAAKALRVRRMKRPSLTEKRSLLNGEEGSDE